MSGDAGQAAAETMREHAVSRYPQGCICGWRGEDHAAHVIHELQMAGLDVVWR